jgi:hypothetical protein
LIIMKDGNKYCTLADASDRLFEIEKYLLGHVMPRGLLMSVIVRRASVRLSVRPSVNIAFKRIELKQVCLDVHEILHR